MMEVKVDNSFGKKDFPETKIIIDSFCISVRESENRIFIQIMDYDNSRSSPWSCFHSQCLDKVKEAGRYWEEKGGE